MQIRVSLDKYLKQQNLSAYKLVQETEGRVARGSVYALARGEQVKRVDLETLGEVMTALERITGHKVNVSDVLEEIEQPVQQDPLEGTGAGELQATLEALETDTPPAELQGWLERFEQVEQAGA